jgi:hypothetical protein
MQTPFRTEHGDVPMPTLEQAREIVNRAGYLVHADFDTGTVKVEGYAPMTASQFLQFANGLRAPRTAR